jgi:hypothetical protein
MLAFDINRLEHFCFQRHRIAIGISDGIHIHHRIDGAPARITEQVTGTGGARRINGLIALVKRLKRLLPRLTSIKA